MTDVTRKSKASGSGSATAVAPCPAFESEPLATVPAFGGFEAEETEDDAGARVELEQMLLFRLDSEWYAVAVKRVREVLNGCPVSPVPCVPEFVLGVMSLRGEVVSVTDLGRLMGIGGVDGGCGRLPGVVLENDECATVVPVDELGELVQIALGEVEPPVRGADRSLVSYVAGSVEVGGTMMCVIDVDRVLTPIGDKPRSSAYGSRKVDS